MVCAVELEKFSKKRIAPTITKEYEEFMILREILFFTGEDLKPRQRNKSRNRKI